MQIRAVTTVLLLLALHSAACGPDDPRGDRTLNVRAAPGTADVPFFRVLGTDLTRFRGQIGDSTGSRSVDGVVPQDYVLENARDFASGTFSKTVRGRQALTAQVFVDGELRSEKSTNVEFGSVTVTAPLDNQE